jgi:rhodanese-related sulfurtransferase
MKISCFLVLLLACILTFVQTEHVFSQTQSEAIEGEIVEVPGGSYRNILPEQLSSMLKKKDFLFINVHIPYEGEIEKTDLFIPYEEMEQNLNKLPADKESKIVIYCRTDRMSIIAARTLVKLGYKNVWNLKGGMTAWRQAGYPLIEKSMKDQ